MAHTHRLELIVGPPQCGKSALAEARTLALGREIERLYVATLPALPFFAERIERHRYRRRNAWRVVEIDRELAEALAVLRTMGDRRSVLLDGISAYVGRLIDRELLLSSKAPALSRIERSCRRTVDAIRRDCDHLVVVGTALGDEADEADPWNVAAMTANRLILAELASVADQVTNLPSKDLHDCSADRLGR